MSVEEVDEYLAALDEPRRSTLIELRCSILAVVPDAEQGLSYGVPVFRIGGKNVAGFSAAKNHLSYLPHSGTVLGTFAADDLGGFAASKGALKMPVDTPIPRGLVARLIAARRTEAGV
jgi:uncharacterized protein YdhG (YjbR/CyaY superfamily)